MCFGRCARCIGYQLLVLALLCIVANVLLYFPNGETRYAAHNLLSKYVGCLHGIIGGGLLVLVPAFTLIGLEHGHFHGCFAHEHYGRNCTPLVVVLVACIGIAGAAYCFIICCLALSEGPYCYCWTERIWCSPFSNSYGGYLLEHNKWTLCQEPRYIVQWNITLFSILLVLSGYELILCIIQIIHGCLGGAWTVCYGEREKNPC
ncbi:transmembrane 4 L6 family member 1-like isoform X2 [Paroedura picta]|uniref:transmembrane 4 L6 family member 1-like isoform X2 n=1 Tax=Paroedura picta TaxID=143630 RepID=UPI0040563A44